MAARLLLASATLSLTLLAARQPAAAQTGTASVQISGAMSESFDMALAGGSFGPSGNLHLAFIGRNMQELYIRTTDPISTGTIQGPPCADVDCRVSLMIVPSSDPPFGSLTIVSSLAPDHRNSCRITIDVKDNVGVRGSFECTFYEGRITATGQFATTDAPAGSTGPPEEPSSLGLACDRNDVQEYGRITCNAAVSNIHQGAQITYRWTLNGIDRSDTGRDLSLSNIAPGDYTISVTATDQTTNSTIGSQSVSFTRYAPGTREAEDAGKFGTNLTPLIAGTAIAIAIALGGLTLHGRKPRPPKTKSRIQYVPSAPQSKPAVSRPLSGPEDLPTDSSRDKKRKRPRPTLSVRIILRPSVLVQQLYNSRDISILGDTVDFMFAGYELRVGPPGEWDIDNSMPRYAEPHSGGLHAIEATWTIGGGEWKPANEFAKLGEAEFRNLYRNDPFGTRTDSNNAVIFSKKWHKTDDSMTAAVRVTARVRSTDQTETDVVEAIDMASEPIVIVGAKPELTLTATTPNRTSIGLTPEEGGGVTGSADGADKIRVEPVLYLFDGIYAGGLRIAGIDNRVAPPAPPEPALYLDDFFEVIREDPRIIVDGTSYVDEKKKSMMREGLTLRCRLRLSSKGLSRIPEDGFPLRMTVEPTGSAYGLETLEKRFDWVLRDHYRACAVQYKPEPLPPSEPVHIRVVPATIEVSDPDPKTLPIVATGDDRFTSRISARIHSFHGDPVKVDKSAFKRDISIAEIKQWHFRFWYHPPTEKWRREIDPGLRQEEGIVLNATDIDDEGRIVFDGKPHLQYNHNTHFRKPVKREWRPQDSDEANWYLRGQTCDINFEFRALGKRVSSTTDISPDDWISYRGKHPIHIDAVEREYYKVTVRVYAESGEPLSGAEVDVGPDSSPQWEQPDLLIEGRPDRVTRGTTDSTGAVTLYMVPGRLKPYRLVARWTTSPMSGRQLSPAVDPDAPPPTLRTGTTVQDTFEEDYEGDDSTDLKLPVNTKWALQTDLSFTLGPSIGVVGGGAAIMSALLVNRVRMPTGDPPGGIRQGMVSHVAPDPRMWKRMILVGAYGALGKSPVNFVGIEFSEPGSSEFTTKTPVAWADFHTSRTRIWSSGGSAGVGYSFSSANFDEVATDPVDIRLDSASAGFSGATAAQMMRGKWILLD